MKMKMLIKNNIMNLIWRHISAAISKTRAQVADELSFLNFMTVVAARTATNVNYEALAGEVGVSAPTVKQWMSILVSSGLVALIPAYSNNALKRVIKAPRMYFLDTGLCSHLTRWSSAESYGARCHGQAVLKPGWMSRNIQRVI